MVWAFHVQASKPGKPNLYCQACLMEARLRGEKRITKLPRLPCERHGSPELWEINWEAWSLYQLVQDQVLVFDQYDAKGEPKPPLVRLNFAAVIPVLSLYVPHSRRRECFEKMLLIHEIMQSKGVWKFFTTHTLVDIAR